MRSLNKEPTVFISAGVPYLLRQQVAELARRDGVPLSEEIRQGLLLLLEKRRASVESRDPFPSKVA